MSGTRQALVLGAIPILVGALYLFLQTTRGDDAEWLAVDGNVLDAAGNFIAKVTGNLDPAGVTLLVALGLAMGFGMFVILRGARDL